MVQIFQKDLTPNERPLAIIGLIAALGAAGAAVYFVHMEAWPATILIELQAAIFDGGYYPRFTIVVLWMAFFAPVAAVLLLVKQAIRQNSSRED